MRLLASSKIPSSTSATTNVYQANSSGLLSNVWLKPSKPRSKV